MWSDGNKTVTVSLRNWKWSDGEQVTGRDVIFFMNVYKANPAANYCDYVPGLFPDIVKSMSSPDPSTVVFRLTKAVSPTWFLYNELSQITPLPLAWDRTSLSQPAPAAASANLPDHTKAGAEAVYKFLDAQSKAVSSWSTSPLWKVVDGPFRLTGYTTAGQVTMKDNPDYSGSPKPKIKTFVELPFTSDASETNLILSGGPKALTVGYLPPEDIPQEANAVAAGYVANNAYLYATNYFPLNLNNPKFGPVFRQTYFRPAFQHLVDQPGWINAFLHKAAHPTYGPVPLEPSPFFPQKATANPFPFSVPDAATLLKANGWDVKPGGITVCARPGTAKGDCGAGVPAGLGLQFNIDYVAGIPSVESEMNDLAAQAARVGIKLELTSHPYNTIGGTVTPCQPTQSSCSWTAENWGGGWNFTPDFLPTGESLFLTGGGYNYSNYSDSEANRLIEATLTASPAKEQKAMLAYSNYLEQSLPVVFEPTPVGNPFSGGPALIDKNLTGYSPNAYTYITPEEWSIK